MLFQSISFSDITEVYQKVLKLLDRDIKIISNRTGWHQFIEEQKVGDAATAQGILIYDYLNHSHRLLKDCLTTLREAQCQNMAILDYGGGHF